MKRLSKVSCAWSAELAYAVGLLATDGNLSPDGRHIHFTSKDEELVSHFQNCLHLTNTIGRKGRGGSKDKKYFVLQFGDKNFYDFLLHIGLTPAKSKTIAQLSIPALYFRDFLRGCVDGDGCVGVTWHPESKQGQLRTRLFSASRLFLEWLRVEIANQTGVEGGSIGDHGPGRKTYALAYGKRDSILLGRYMYYAHVQHYLRRKYQKIHPFLGRVAELV